MKIRLASTLQPDSIVDGEGIRTVIWTQGCPHHCPGCHNPGTHDFTLGSLVEVEEIKEQLTHLSGQDGITFSGGDPMYQPRACKEIAQYAKTLGLTVWCYTGDTFEEVLQNQEKRAFLNHIDVLVDGKFDLSQRSLDLQFKGSANQRIIDVPKSLDTGSIVLKKEYESPKDYCNLYQKPDYLFI